jgi:hypothetical protein
LLSHDLKNFAGQPQALANFIIDTKPSEEVVELAVDLSIIQASVSIYRKLYQIVERSRRGEYLIELDIDPIFFYSKRSQNNCSNYC